jgi:hypothetical protein
VGAHQCSDKHEPGCSGEARQWWCRHPNHLPAHFPPRRPTLRECQSSNSTRSEYTVLLLEVIPAGLRLPLQPAAAGTSDHRQPNQRPKVPGRPTSHRGSRPPRPASAAAAPRRRQWLRAAGRVVIYPAPPHGAAEGAADHRPQDCLLETAPPHPRCSLWVPPAGFVTELSVCAQPLPCRLGGRVRRPNPAGSYQRLGPPVESEARMSATTSRSVPERGMAAVERCAAGRRTGAVACVVAEWLQVGRWSAEALNSWGCPACRRVGWTVYVLGVVVHASVEWSLFLVIVRGNYRRVVRLVAVKGSNVVLDLRSGRSCWWLRVGTRCGCWRSTVTLWCG